jgi:hypothetical protein
LTHQRRPPGRARVSAGGILPTWHNPPFVRPAGGRSTVGTPFVPTAPHRHGAQERSRDETACGARLGARPLTAPSTVAPPQLGLINQRSGDFSISTSGDRNRHARCGQAPAAAQRCAADRADGDPHGRATLRRAVWCGATNQRLRRRRPPPRMWRVILGPNHPQFLPTNRNFRLGGASRRVGYPRMVETRRVWRSE